MVYGDTDSLFVLVKGATKEEAFKIGNEIVDAVTAENPKPVKLKFEKVSSLNKRSMTFFTDFKALQRTLELCARGIVFASVFYCVYHHHSFI